MQYSNAEEKSINEKIGREAVRKNDLFVEQYGTGMFHLDPAWR